MPYYHQILAAHLVAVSVFGAGILLNTFLLPSLKRGEAAQREELRRLWRWSLYVTTPALCFVWGLGGTLAVLAGWLPALWLQIKLVFVAFLTAIHVYQLFALRRLQHHGVPKGISLWLALPVVGALAAIVTLAAAKPMAW